MALVLVREASAAAVGAASGLLGEGPVLAGLGVSRGLAVEFAAVAVGLTLTGRAPQEVSTGLVTGGIALLASRLTRGMLTASPYQAFGLQAANVNSNGFQFI